MLYACMNVCVLISSQAEVKGLNSILKSTLLLEEMFNSTSFVSLKLVVEGLRDFVFSLLFPLSSYSDKRLILFCLPRK